MRPDASYWNCSWTALNFFAQRPDPRYVDLTLAEDALKRECRLLNVDRAYGGVLVWRDELGKPLQMAVRFPCDGVPKIPVYRKRSA